MYAIRRDFKTQPALPTGPNPMPPLSEFEVKKKSYALNLQAPYGRYEVEIDMTKQVGFYTHALNGFGGQFWLSGHTLIASEHILPSDVRIALRSLSIDLA